MVHTLFFSKALVLNICLLEGGVRILPIWGSRPNSISQICVRGTTETTEMRVVKLKPSCETKGVRHSVSALVGDLAGCSFLANAGLFLLCRRLLGVSGRGVLCLAFTCLSKWI